MARGSDRIDWIAAALQQANLDALICGLPENVLMLSGYWPVVGTSVALVARGGQIAVLAPEDEKEQARHGWATEVRTYQPSSLTSPFFRDQCRKRQNALAMANQLGSCAARRPS